MQGCFYHALFDRCYTITLINYFSKCKSRIYLASHSPIVIMFLPTIFSRERSEKTCTADVIDLLRIWISVKERNVIHKGLSKYCPQVNRDTESFKRNWNTAHTLAKLKIVGQAKIEGEAKDRPVTTSSKNRLVLLNMKMIPGKLTILLV